MDYNIEDIGIPEEVLDEWHVYKGDAIGMYQTFLMVTDYKITKLYEELAMNPGKEEEIKAKFREENGMLMEYRQTAREALGPLLDEMYRKSKAFDDLTKKLYMD